MVVFSYRTVAALAGLVALWCWLAYEWLGLPESSALMLILALLWALAQIVAASIIVGGIVSGAVHAAAAEGMDLPINSLWKLSKRSILNALIFLMLCALVALVCSDILGWIGDHSLEVASFLTVHLGSPVNRVRIDQLLEGIEGLFWIVLSGYFLSLFTTLLREGWRSVRKQRWRLLGRSVFHRPMVASLLSVGVFGLPAYKLVNWHHTVPPGFWDYTQLVMRFSFVLLIISAGWCFWVLSLARQQVAQQQPPEI